MSESDDSRRAAVRETMERYTRAVFEADVGTLTTLFAPGAFMAGYLGDRLLVGTPQPFLDDIGDHPSMAESEADYVAEMTGLEVQGRAATVTLNERGFFGMHRFVNYFSLLEIEGEWKIMSKTFAAL